MNKTNLLLQMMEQPHRYTAEEWQEILSDEECRELYSLMSKTQSAISAARADEVVTDDMIDAEWQQLSTVQPYYSLYKIAAMLVGILMLSGVAYAAIHILSHIREDLQSPTHNTQMLDSYHPALSTDTTKYDTIPHEPKLYDDVPLGDIFNDLSNYYQVKVVFQNEDASRLRLFYQWKPEYTLEKVVEMLNNFNWIQIQAENDTLFISTTPAQDSYKQEPR
jgi:hypothetical protein